MNKVRPILEALSDSDLKQAVTELRAHREAGVLPDGIIRQLTQRIHRETGISINDARQSVQYSVMEIAAFKWAQAETPAPASIEQR